MNYLKQGTYTLMLIRKKLFAILTTLLVMLPAVCGAQQATRRAEPEQTQQVEFTVVDNPGGGQFAYGTLTGQTTLTGGMVKMLRQVHARFGEKPQIGKLFQSRDGGSLATFFTLSAKNDGGKSVTGLVIVTMHEGKAPQAAAIYDDAEKFLQSEPSLVQGLSKAWSEDTEQKGATAAQKAISARLHKVTGGDNSASIGLPDDWHLVSVHGGQLTAEGPHSEQLALNIFIPSIADSPKYKMPANKTQLVCPLTADLYTAFVNVFNQLRQNNKKPAATFTLTSQQQLPPGYGPIRPVQALFTIDLNDGVGPRKASARLDVFQTPGLHQWSMMVSTSNIPVKYADEENDLLMAIIKSYRLNDDVISKQSREDIDRIRRNEINKRSDADDARVIRGSGDTSDWSSKVMQYYILDGTVLGDVASGVCDRYADALVKAHPEQLEVAAKQDLMQGSDY
jgi:hypothetical protein